MALSEIKNKLYKKEADSNLSQHDKTEFDTEGITKGVSSEENKQEDQWVEEKKGFIEEQKKFIKIGAIILSVIFFIVAVGGIVYKIRQSAFSEKKVIISIEGKTDVESGKFITYEIKYKNDNRVDLKNASLRLNYPESLRPEVDPNLKAQGLDNSIAEIGDIKAHTEGKIILNSRIYSPKGTLLYLKAELLYTPSNFNSQFTSSNQLGINVTSTAMNMEITGPLNISNGDAVDYLITYKNNGIEEFGNVRVKLDYAEGFSFSSSEPKVSEGENIWHLGNLSPGEEGKIVISGKLEGEKDQIKKTKAELGTVSQGQFVSYNEETTETKIIRSPLSIIQVVNNNVEVRADAGGELFVEIQYGNTGELGLSNVIITEKIDSPMLDYSSLKLNRKGAFSEETKTITWKASDFPILANLEAGAGGKISFSIKLKNVFPIVTADDKNFSIPFLARIDSPDVPTPLEMNKIIAGNKVDVRVNSKLVVDAEGYYNDSVIGNSGPIPPTVGAETTYSIHWKVMNISNDVADAKVETILPTGVVYTGKKYPENSNLTYDERNNKLTWVIGDISSGMGILTAKREIVFQVKIVPASNQQNQPVALTGESVYSARDLFTGANLSAQVDAKDTRLREDSGIAGTGYKVIAN